MKKRKSLFLVLAIALMTVAAVSVGLQKNAAYAASGTPISTAEEFLAMENDSAGSYYLVNDITVPTNTALFQKTQFTGTLDGNGHTIKGYTYSHASGEHGYAGLIRLAKGATFKNLTISDVNINVDVQSEEGTTVAALVSNANNCTFDNVKVSGKINVKGSASDVDYCVAGIAGYTTQGTYTGCNNSVAVTVTYKPSTWTGNIYVSGIAGGYNPTLKKCTNSGTITVQGSFKPMAEVYAAGISAQSVYKADSCKNTGKITVSLSTADVPHDIYAAGICGVVDKSITSCANKGTIKVTSAGKVMGVFMGGVAAQGRSVSKCYNKGAVTFSGYVGVAGSYEDDDEGLFAGGVFGCGLTSINQSYNKGVVKAIVESGTAKVGGLGGDVFCGVKNCYNVGKVTLKGNGAVGGVLGYGFVTGDTITCIYNAGKVIGKNKANKGILIGSYGGAETARKCNIYNNYYRGSGKAYGEGYITWKAYRAKAKKVSSITKKKCPKLSSKFWTYSSKYKRMILKKNKEVK